MHARIDLSRWFFLRDSERDRSMGIRRFAWSGGVLFCKVLSEVLTSLEYVNVDF